MKILIPGYEEGSDLTILNTFYSRPFEDISDDYICLIYKDNVNGGKYHYTVNKPAYEYYVEPEDPGYRKFFEDESKLKKVTTRYRYLNKSIAKELGLEQEYKDNIRSKNFRQNRLMFGNNRLYRADVSINNLYRMAFARTYTNRVVPVTKSFLDIETDNRPIHWEFPEPGQVPINAISFLDYDSRLLITVLLDDGNNPKMTQWIKTYEKDRFHREFMKLLTDTIGGEGKLKHFGLDTIKTKQIVYKDELAMLTDLFGFINSMSPDFLLAWNMSFDIPFIIHRIKNLKEDPCNIICDPTIDDVKVRHCSYIIDEMHSQTPAERGDFADITSRTVFLDQMIQFASRRKGQSVFTKYKLDYIGEEIAGVNKLDYSDITSNVGKLPYLDYDTFVKYNMMDVIVQFCIEKETSDIDFVFNRTITSHVEYSKAHRQTTFLANRAIMRFNDYGNWIVGDNANKFKDKPKEKFEGAFVSDPLLNSSKIKQKVRNSTIDLIHNVVDEDYTRMYPSIAQQWNMAPNTQVGRLEIPVVVYEGENRLHNPKYNRSGAFIEDYLSDNYIEFMHRWFGLGNFEEVYKDIFEYFTYFEAAFDNTLYDDIYHCPIIAVNFFDKDHPINVVQFFDQDRNTDPVPLLTDDQKNYLNVLFGREKLDVIYNDFGNNQ